MVFVRLLPFLRLPRPWALAALLALAPAPAARAQTRALDSLRRVVARPMPPPPLDTARVLTLDELCWQLLDHDLPAARRHGEQGLALARRIGFRGGELVCLNDLAAVAMRQQDLSAAAGYYQALLRGLGSGRRSAELEAAAYTGLGNVALQGQQYVAAGRHFRQGLAQATARRDPEGIRLATINLTNLYGGQLSDHAPDSLVAQARTWARRLLALPAPGTAPAAADQGAAYAALAEAAAAQHRPDSAAYFNQRAVAAFRADGDAFNALAAELQLAR